MMPQIVLFATLFFDVACSTICTAQLTRADTVLFLHFDDATFYKSPFFIRLTKGGTPKLRIMYSFGSYYKLYDGLPLEFATKLDPKPDTIKLSKLKKTKIATHDDLILFIQHNYRKYETSQYFLQLKSIYMVEPTKKKGYVTVTKVKLNIDIE